MTYRKDIQILRGVAVLLVVFFHLGLMHFRSGFLGVDVFFVISGFLMAVMYDHNEKKIFITKRALRLLPAYYVTVIFTIIVSIFVLLPREFYQTTNEALYVDSFIINFYYWLKSSYFSKSDFKPFLHLWSLGVEIQYYLIIPILFYFFRKRQCFFWLCFFASLFLCFFKVQDNPKASFFLMPLRVWEFLVGYCVAKYFTLNGSILKINSTKQAIGSIFFFIIAAIPLFDVKQSYSFISGHPGLYALLITISTGGVIACGINNKFENSLFGSFLEVIGKYSYSIYLVHFPVIVLFLYKPFKGTNIKIENSYDLVCLITIITLLSFGMYNLIEVKLRRNKKIIHILFSFPIIVIFLVSFANNIQKFFYTKEELFILNSYSDRSYFRCGSTYSVLHPGQITCQITETTNRNAYNLLLIGNSFADSIKYEFANVANSMNVNVYFIIPNNPLMNNSNIRSETILNEIRNLNVTSIVFHYSLSAINKSLISEINEIINFAKKSNIFVSYIMPPPSNKYYVPQVLWEELKYNKQIQKKSVKDYKNETKILRNYLSAILSDNFKLYEVFDYFCNEECSIADSYGRPLYFDQEHLTLTGSCQMTKLFESIINDYYSYQQR